MHVHIYIYIYTHSCVYIYIYVYILVVQNLGFVSCSTLQLLRILLRNDVFPELMFAQPTRSTRPT